VFWTRNNSQTFPSSAIATNSSKCHPNSVAPVSDKEQASSCLLPEDPVSPLDHMQSGSQASTAHRVRNCCLLARRKMTLVRQPHDWRCNEAAKTTEDLRSSLESTWICLQYRTARAPWRAGARGFCCCLPKYELVPARKQDFAGEQSSSHLGLCSPEQHAWAHQLRDS